MTFIISLYSNDIGNNIDQDSLFVVIVICLWLAEGLIFVDDGMLLAWIRFGVSLNAAFLVFFIF